MAWQTDWSEFVRAAGQDLDNGLSDRDLTEKYCDCSIEWVGKVTEAKFGRVPNIACDMPPVSLKLLDGRFGVTSYLSLTVEPQDVQEWRAVIAGDIVRFQTSISRGIGPFPGLSWADLGDGKGYLSVGTRRSTLLEIVGRRPDDE